MRSVLFIEPFYGGSHKFFADRVVAHSAHRVHLLTLPARFWKWRMRGAHLWLAEKVRARLGKFDCLLVSDMLSLGELQGVVPELAGIPKIVYFHENQFAYPVPGGESPDVHFGFTNLSTALAAQALVFNSRFQKDSFQEGLEALLREMPDYRPRGVERELRMKAAVIYPGVDCVELDRFRRRRRREKPLTILWNHRWEFDKCPEIFFRVLRDLAGEDLEFRVHVVGENFQVKPTPFLEAREFMESRIGKFGFVPRRADYIRVLWDSDVVVSTAVQEFFGISVMEAVYCGCLPLVPKTLVYPELYPEECCYLGEKELHSRLAKLLRDGLPGSGWCRRLRSGIRRHYDVRQSVRSIDELIEGVLRGEKR